MIGPERSPDGSALGRLIAGLSDRRAYAFPVAEVEVRQTHISVVFLAGSFAYKVKKPVELGFLDYRTVDARRHYCEEEVRLNRRLAPGVYLGVVPVRETAAGGFAFEGDGPVVDWAVKMERLPAEATLAARLDRERVEPSDIVAVARRLASFHAAAEGGPRVAALGRFAVVSRNVRENFTASLDQVGRTVSPAVFERLRALTEAALGRLRGLIEDRAARGVPRDTHGDPRLDHIYLRPDLPPPHDLVIVDCIEFSARFRHADPVSDLAFPYLDLTAAGRPELAEVLASAYFEASGDDQGRTLLPLYTAYRAAVRAKVDGITAAAPEVAPEQRAAAVEKARARWALALDALETPGRRPCLVLVAGLPGTGKSTLARGLAQHARFDPIRSDLVRKELAAAAGARTGAGAAAGPSEFDQGLYTPEWTDRTYAECLRRAGSMLAEGRRVAVDATFAREDHRREFLRAARAWGVPALVLHCQADPAAVRDRLDRRARTGDASDADWAIHQRAADRWQPPGPATLRRVRDVDSTPGPDATLAVALGHLARAGLRE